MCFTILFARIPNTELIREQTKSHRSLYSYMLSKLNRCATCIWYKTTAYVNIQRRCIKISCIWILIFGVASAVKRNIDALKVDSDLCNVINSINSVYDIRNFFKFAKMKQVIEMKVYMNILILIIYWKLRNNCAEAS